MHPGAIKQLRKIITSLENTNQIVLSTHSTLFINRNKLSSNIIIDDKQAKNATSISAIRDVLGVVVDDNLIKAKCIVYVEGPADKKALSAILKNKNKKLKYFLENGDLIIEPLHGASKLSQMIEYSRNNLCDVYAVVDDDQQGRDAIKKAIEIQDLTAKSYTIIRGRGKKESEFEDLVDPSIYTQAIKDTFNININKRIPGLKTSGLKWSNKMKKIFEVNGKLFDEEEDKLKTVVAKCVEDNPKIAILKPNRPIIDNIVNGVLALFKA